MPQNTVRVYLMGYTYELGLSSDHETAIHVMCMAKIYITEFAFI